MLVTGGTSGSGVAASAELYDPATRRWEPTDDLATARTGHSATLLRNGQVLVAGGVDAAGHPVATAELYEPSSFRRVPDGSLAPGVWSPAGAMATPRSEHTATVLPSGGVLVAGGRDASGTALKSVELFELAPTPTWQAGTPLNSARAAHAATRLASGEVLVIGGSSAAGALRSTERYDPSGRTWVAGPDLPAPASSPTSTLLPSGQVLVIGDGVAAVYDPAPASWSDVGAGHGRSGHTSTLLPCDAGGAPPHCGSVLVAGGTVSGAALATAELFDPADRTWRAAADLIAARTSHIAGALAGGNVLLAGGTPAASTAPLASAEVFNPATAGRPPSITGVAPSGGPVSGGTAITLTGAGLDGAAEVRFGDRPGTNLVAVSATELRVTSPPADGPATVNITVTTGSGVSIPIDQSRFRYAPAPTVTSISPDTGTAAGGTLVVIGGTTFDFPDTAVLFGDVPATIVERQDTQLTVSTPRHDAGPVDVVVVTPGGRSELTFASRFNFGDGTWEAAAPLATGRYHHSATVLGDGRVLVVGGTDDYQSVGNALASAEVYDPRAGTWSAAGSLATPRYSHTATLLDGPACRGAAPRPAWCGRVLVAGGQRQLTGSEAPGNPGWIALASSELYDPATNSWSAAGNLADARFAHTASLLDGPACAAAPAPAYCGKVLVAGGSDSEQNNRAPIRSAELYDPATGLWAKTGDLDPACQVGGCGRTNHTATALPDGRVLVAGGLATSPESGPAQGPSISAGVRAGPLTSSDVSHVVSAPVSGPDARVVMTATPPHGAPVAPGDRITYTVRYFNPGTESTQAAVRVTMPDLVAFDSAGGGAAVSATDPRSVETPMLSVPAGTSAQSPAGTFDVTVTVLDQRPNEELPIPDGANFSVSASIGEGVGTRSASIEHIVLRPAAPRVSLSANPIPGSTVAPGSQITYSLNVFNVGWAAANDVRLKMDLAEEVDFVAASGGGTLDGRTVTFPALAVAAGTSAEQPAAAREITVNVRSERLNGQLVADRTAVDERASIAGVPSNPVRHIVLRAAPTGAEVRLALTANPRPGDAVLPGARITYAIGYYNAGSSAANGVVVTYQVPNGLTLVSASGGGMFDAATKVVTFPPIDLPAGSTAGSPRGRFEITADVIFQPGSVVESIARANPGTFSNPVEHRVASPLVRTVLAADPPSGSPVYPGDEIVYSISYFNLGATSADVEISLPVRSPAVFVAASDGGQFDDATDTVRFPPVAARPGTTATNPAGTLAVTVRLPGLTAAAATAEIYDPAAGSWTATGGMGVARFDHTATLLTVDPCADACGKVLVAGGVERAGPGTPVFTATAELFDPATGMWAPTGSLRNGRGAHTASGLADGTVLAAGGAFSFPIASPAPPRGDAEVYEPTAGAWRETAPMKTPRGMHTATVLASGDVLVTGGGTQGARVVPVAVSATQQYRLPKLAPRVAGVEAGSGPSTGGTVTTVTGVGFEGVLEVLFGTIASPKVDVRSRSQLTAVAPPQASGTVDVTVRTALGRSVASPASRFTYRVSQLPGIVTGFSARITGTEPAPEIVLAFRAPSSDGAFPPPASRYRVVQSTDDQPFNTGTPLCGGECDFAPASVGDELTLTIGDLQPSTSYFYGIRAINDIGVGAASAVVSATTPAGLPATAGEDEGLSPSRGVQRGPTDVATVSPPAQSPAPVQQPAAATTTTPSSTTPTTQPVGGSREVVPSDAGKGDGGTRWGLIAVIWAPVVVGFGLLGAFVSRRRHGKPPAGPAPGSQPKPTAKAGRK